MKTKEMIFATIITVIACVFLVFCIIQVRGCTEHIEDSQSIRYAAKEKWYSDNGYTKVYRSGWSGYVWEKGGGE